MVRKLHPYSQKTVRDGEWCYEVATPSGWWLTPASRRVLAHASVLYVGEFATYLRSRAAAESLVEAFRNHGFTTAAVRGRGTFKPRGFYDDVGYDFVACKDKAEALSLLRDDK